MRSEVGSFTVGLFAEDLEHFSESTNCDRFRCVNAAVNDSTSTAEDMFVTMLKSRGYPANNPLQTYSRARSTRGPRQSNSTDCLQPNLKSQSQSVFQLLWVTVRIRCQDAITHNALLSAFHQGGAQAKLLSICIAS